MNPQPSADYNAGIESLAEDIWDALDAQHDSAYHVHAAECCWPFGGSRDVITLALARVIADAKAEALREAADALILDAKSIYYRDDSSFHASQRWALTDTAPDWLRDRAKHIGASDA